MIAVKEDAVSGAAYEAYTTAQVVQAVLAHMNTNTALCLDMVAGHLRCWTETKK